MEDEKKTQPLDVAFASFVGGMEEWKKGMMRSFDEFRQEFKDQQALSALKLIEIGKEKADQKVVEALQKIVNENITVRLESAEKLIMLNSKLVGWLVLGEVVVFGMILYHMTGYHL